MNILITGSKGQLGNEMQLAAVRYPQFGYIFTDIDELDICDKAALEAFVKANAVDVIVNCAAYTAVDKAESEKELALSINVTAVANLASLCKKNAVQFIIIILARMDQLVVAIAVQQGDRARQPDDFRPRADDGHHLQHRPSSLSPCGWPAELPQAGPQGSSRPRHPGDP